MMVWLVVLTLLASLAWGGIALLNLPPLLVGLATAGLLLLFALGRWVVKKVRTRKASKGLEGALEEQAEQQLKTVRPDLQPEIEAMKGEFAKAVNALKTSKLSRGRKDALAVLPWYLIVGPPGAGKSTALRNSGLKFPYLSAKGGGVRGVGGTRNCDWWLTNEAVLLDTAGRYVSNEDDRAEWFAFLDTLVKYRPERPLNGLIVSLSVTDLLGVDPQQVGELGQSIRERLDEVTTRLRTLMPVYVLLTKCDLIPGFTEMFADLTRSERSQIWGFTVPMGSQSEEASSDLLLERFDELTAVLEQRALRRLGQERRQVARERIYQFPQRFAELRKNLTELLQPIFMDNVFQDTPAMRGLYFTSGTQELKPVEKLPANATELFGEGRPLPEANPEGRSYFLWDIFTKVIFQDQEMAVRSSQAEARFRQRQRVLMGAYLTAALLLLVLPTVSFFQNRSLAFQVHEAITSVTLDRSDDLERVRLLEPLQRLLEELTEHRTSSPPFWLRFGLYQGESLFPEAQGFYNSALRRVLLGQQYERIEQSLDTFGRQQDEPTWRPSEEDYRRHFEELKLYLLATWPRASREQPLDDDHQDWLARQMVQHWASVKGTGGEAGLERTVDQHARTYIKMLAADPENLAFSRNDRVVRAARRALNRVPLATLELEQIISDMGRAYGDLTLDEVVGAVPAMRATRHVRAAFTRKTWETAVRSRLESAFRNKQAWVLDRDSQEDEEQSRAELRTRYYEKYIQEWRDFLNSISVQAPRDVDEMEALLTSLTRGKPPPYGKLFRALAHNVQLQTVDNKPEGLADRLLKNLRSKQAEEPARLVDEQSATGERELGPKDVEKTFATLIRFSTQASSTEDGEEKLTALDFYQDQLATVQNTLLAVKEKPSESANLLKDIRSTREKVRMLVNRQDSDNPLLERLLLPPLQDMDSVVFGGIAQNKSVEWCDAIYSPFLQTMEGRYPFTRDTMLDAPLPELARLLRPAGGQLREFLQKQLGDEIVPSGRRWTYANAQTRSMYRDELLTFLEKANALSITLFPTADNVDPLVRFQVRIRAGSAPEAAPNTAPSEVASVTLTIDGTEETYRNGPDNVWKPMAWPGLAGKLGASLHVVNASGATADLEAPGEWGLFRLLERAQRIEPSGDGRFFTAVWEIEEMGGALISIDFRPERTANPFFGLSGNNTSRLLQIFRDPGLKPPAGIARSGKSCDQLLAADNAPAKATRPVLSSGGTP